MNLSQSQSKKLYQMLLFFSEITVYYNGSYAQVKAANINGSNLVKSRDIINLLGREVWWNADKKRVGCGKVYWIFIRRFMREQLIPTSGILLKY